MVDFLNNLRFFDLGALFSSVGSVLLLAGAFTALSLNFISSRQ